MERSLKLKDNKWLFNYLLQSIITSVKTPSYSDIHLKYRENLQGFNFLANGVLESQAMWHERVKYNF